MPELPDLEAFSRNLSKSLKGKIVQTISARATKRMKTGEEVFNSTLIGAAVDDVYREGKELRIAFNNGTSIGLHLMLKGKLHLLKGENQEKSTVFEIRFTDGLALAMSDFQRQANAALNPETKEAPDALSRKVNYSLLKDKFARSRSAVKSILTDQDFIRGIGNAYADEILWHARIHPSSACDKIPDSAIKTLAKSIGSVLRNATKQILKAEPEIISGELRDFLAVHDHRKTHSPTGAKIKTLEMGGRKTYFTNEQKLFK